MSVIKIEWTYDECDCETCGMSWADGAIVTIDGKQVGDFTPFASCFDGTSFTKEFIYASILRELGHTVVEEEIGYEQV